MKKILFISNEGSITGAPLFLVKLVLHLKDKANYNILTLFATPGPLIKSLENKGIEVIIYEKRRTNISLYKKILIRIVYYFRYLKLLLCDRPCLIYSNTIVNFGEIILAGLLRIPVILHVHEGKQVANNYRFRLRLSSFFLDDIIVGSEYVNNVLFDITKKHGSVIYIGVQPPNNLIKIKPSNVQHFRLGVIGTIIPNKGQHVAIEALKILIGCGFSAQLVIAGISADDSYLEEIKNYVTKNFLSDFVFFIGAVDSSENFINNLDLLLVPSFDEALPTVILEAFSLRTPVVASHVGGIPEIIQNGLSGFLFKAGDSAMLADCLIRVIHDDNLLKSITTNAATVVMNKFNVNENNTQIESRINKILLQ